MDLTWDWSVRVESRHPGCGRKSPTFQIRALGATTTSYLLV